MPNLKFYFTAMRQVGSPMADFLIDCYLTASVKAEHFLFFLCTMPKKLRAMRHSAEWKKVCTIMPNFYFTAMRQARSPMAEFFINCYFNDLSFVRTERIFFLTLSYAKKLNAMRHSAELKKSSFFCNSTLYHLVWNSSQKFSCQLRAMRHIGELTLRYAT
jgi:hypothetical protein